MKVSVSALVSSMVISFLGACASQPPSAPAAASVVKTAQGPAAGPISSLTGEKLIAMQKAGYKIVDRDGQTYFCRTEKKTGSQIARDTVCITEKEADNLRDVTQRSLGEITRQTPPPQGK